MLNFPAACETLFAAKVFIEVCPEIKAAPISKPFLKKVRRSI